MLDSRLSYVVAVYRAGSFTAAAAMVGVTQSAITKSVADLEQQVGYAIFHRTRRGVLLSEEGRDFVERAARLLGDAEDLFRRERHREDPYAGVLRIGVCPASLEWRLPGPLALLLKKHPSIRLDVVASTFERIARLLRNGGVDVALGFDEGFSGWSDVRRESIPPVESALFARIGHPIFELQQITEQDLTQYILISPSEGRPTGPAVKRIFDAVGLDWQGRVHVIDYFPAVKRLVATTDAIGVVTRAHAQSSAFRLKFATLDQADFIVTSPMCCALRSRWEPKPAVRAFIAAVRDIPV
jgi:DNA-binding transcriptional LysR family regulator